MHISFLLLINSFFNQKIFNFLFMSTHENIKIHLTHILYLKIRFKIKNKYFDSN